MVERGRCAPACFIICALLLAAGMSPGFGSARPDCLSGAPGPQSESAPTALAERLGTLLAGLPAQTRVGLVVAEVDGGALRFVHGADTPLKPASLQKLFVTAAALERFGPTFRYETRVYRAGDELWVIGAGDPGLGDARLAQRYDKPVDHAFDEWAAALRAHGVTTLAKIVLDDTVFEDRGRHPDWPDDQADRWYQAPVGGLNLNDNCLDVTVELRNGVVELSLWPDLPAELVQNRLVVGKKQRPILKRRAGSAVFELSGSVKSGGLLDPVSAERPTVFFGYALHRALVQRGIDAPGPVVRRRLSSAELDAAELLATHTTALPDALWRCNTFSQNMFAECLLKSLAAYRPDGRRSGTAGSWEGGREVLRATLTRLGVDVEAATFRDGSGLSHSNRATARQIVQLLLVMHRQRHAAFFLESLAEPGRAGSMHKRYDHPALRGRLRGKTGTISGVRCLAGYVTQPGGTVLAFALLVNGKVERDFPLRVCRALVVD